MSRYLKPLREHFIPKGAAKVADKLSSAVAYLYGKPDAPCAMVFAGKQQKPAWRYRFRTPAHREKNVTAFFEAVRASEGRKVARREARKAWVNTYQVGDIVGTCWGYDQTNREYFEIVAVKGKRVTLREVGTAGFETGWLTGKSAPLAGNYIGEPFDRMASESGIKIDDVRRATPVAFQMVEGVKVYQARDWSAYA